MNGQSESFLYSFAIYNDIPLNLVDTLKNYNLDYGFYILNLDYDINMGSKGTHWIAIFHSLDHNLKDKFFYFDSYGYQPPNEFLQRINIKDLFYSNIQFQEFNEDDKNCGIWCLIFLKLISFYQKPNLKDFNFLLEYMKDIEIIY